VRLSAMYIQCILYVCILNTHIYLQPAIYTIRYVLFTVYIHHQAHYVHQDPCTLQCGPPRTHITSESGIAISFSDWRSTGTLPPETCMSLRGEGEVGGMGSVSEGNHV